ncbi:MAG: rRNA adenine N-6-methyltransferase family protein [bacterium]
MLPIRKRKSIAQHFLKDKETIEKIADFVVSRIPDKPYILFEIGAGEGTLTIPLLNKIANLPSEKLPQKVILNEIDYRYLRKLNQKMQEKLDKTLSNLQIEIQTIEFQKISLQYENIYLIGNIPFYITGMVLRKIMENYFRIDSVCLNLQKEVVDKISKADNPLGIVFKIGWEIQKGIIIHPSKYDPPPKVFSQIIFLKNLRNPVYCEKLNKFIFRIFKSKKRILSNVLTDSEKSKIKDMDVLRKRPIELSIDQIIQLYHVTLNS